MVTRSFHISAGAFISDNKVTITTKPNPGVGYEINHHLYTPSQITGVDGNVELSKGFLPYLGIGWSKKAEKSGFGFFCDLGMACKGGPETKLTAYGPAAGSPQVQADLRADEVRANEDLDFFQYYPVAQAGVMYRF